MKNRRSGSMAVRQDGDLSYSRLGLKTNSLRSEQFKKKTLGRMRPRVFPQQRRARDSNPQPLAGQLISNQPPHQFGYPPGQVLFSSGDPFVKPFDCEPLRRLSQSEVPLFAT